MSSAAAELIAKFFDLAGEGLHLGAKFVDSTGPHGILFTRPTPAMLHRRSERGGGREGTGRAGRCWWARWSVRLRLTGRAMSAPGPIMRFQHLFDAPGHVA